MILLHGPFPRPIAHGGAAFGAIAHSYSRSRSPLGRLRLRGHIARTTPTRNSSSNWTANRSNGEWGTRESVQRVEDAHGPVLLPRHRNAHGHRRSGEQQEPPRGHAPQPPGTGRQFAFAPHGEGQRRASVSVPGDRKCAAKMFRADADGIAFRDDANEVVDFHALRHTFITNLARGKVHPKIAQALARHSTITLTMDRYTHTDLGEQADALLPNPHATGSGSKDSLGVPLGVKTRQAGDCGRLRWTF